MHDRVPASVLSLKMSKMPSGSPLRRSTNCFRKNGGGQSQCLRGLCLSPLAGRISPGRRPFALDGHLSDSFRALKSDIDLPRDKFDGNFVALDSSLGDRQMLPALDLSRGVFQFRVTHSHTPKKGRFHFTFPAQYCSTPLNNNSTSALWFLMENFAKNRQTRRKLVLTTIMLLVIIPASLYVIRPASAVATYTDSPVAGWGATRLKDTDPNSTASNSVVFPGQKASNFEQLALREASLGYNTIRGSFSPYCTAKYGLTPPDPSNYHFIGDYNATQLARAIKIANYLSFWLVVDYHGYSDLTNSTTASCWQSVWFGNNTNTISGPTGIVGQFKNNYTRIIWEPLNEPTSLPGANATAKTTYLSSQYQTWINNARKVGDTHSVVVQNICSFSCGFCPTGNGDCSAAVSGYPTVNDTLGKVFISLHTYMSPLTSGNGFPNGYTNASAEADATAYYNTVVSGISQTGWQAFNTEGGAFVSNGVNKTIPQQDIILKGSAGYANITLHFIQTLTNLYDANTPQRIGHLWWPAASWASYPYTGTYGALNLNNGWGTLLTSKHFSVFSFVASTTLTESELTVPESQQRTFQNPRGQHGYYLFYRDSINSVQTCYYATSPDGSGWTSAQGIGLSTLYDSCSVTYAQDSSNSRTLVYFVGSRHSTSVGTNHNIDFRIGSIADSGVSLTWITTLTTVRTSNSTVSIHQRCDRNGQRQTERGSMQLYNPQPELQPVLGLQQSALKQSLPSRIGSGHHHPSRDASHIATDIRHSRHQRRVQRSRNQLPQLQSRLRCDRAKHCHDMERIHTDMGKYHQLRLRPHQSSSRRANERCK